MTLLAPERLALLLGSDSPAAGLPEGTGVAFDSREVRRGDVFFALRGEALDGFAYVGDALAAGAAFAVTARPHPRALVVPDVNQALLALGRAARRHLERPVVTVTGSNGKTTTKALLAAALGATATPGNRNTLPALAQTLVEAASAPPTTLVLELGIDHVGEMAQLTDLTRPDHAVITTIGPSHLAGLGDIASVAREKGALFAATTGRKVISQSAAQAVPGQLLEGATVVTPHVTLDGLRGSTVELMGQRVRLPWPGRPTADAAALALTLAVELGVPLDVAAPRMLGAELEGGRLRLTQAGSRLVIDDSYNSNPTSLEAALELLGTAPAPRVAFLGSMLELGALEEAAHLRAGAATRSLDLVVAVGEASRPVLAGNPAARWVSDAVAARELLSLVPDGATVLVKGSRGMRMERLVAAALEEWSRAPAEAAS